MAEFDRDGQLVPPVRRLQDWRRHVESRTVTCSGSWSEEHQAWWRPDAWGYTPNVHEAGWFTAEDTLRYLYGSACGSLPGRPNEVAVDASGLRFVLELQQEASDELQA